MAGQRSAREATGQVDQHAPGPVQTYRPHLHDTHHVCGETGAPMPHGMGRRVVCSFSTPRLVSHTDLQEDTCLRKARNRWRTCTIPMATVTWTGPAQLDPAPTPPLGRSRQPQCRRGRGTLSVKVKEFVVIGVLASRGRLVWGGGPHARPCTAPRRRNYSRQIKAAAVPGGGVAYGGVRALQGWSRDGAFSCRPVPSHDVSKESHSPRAPLSTPRRRGTAAQWRCRTRQRPAGDCPARRPGGDPPAPPPGKTVGLVLSPSSGCSSPGCLSTACSPYGTTSTSFSQAGTGHGPVRTRRCSRAAGTFSSYAAAAADPGGACLSTFHIQSRPASSLAASRWHILEEKPLARTLTEGQTRSSQPSGQVSP